MVGAVGLLYTPPIFMVLATSTDSPSGLPVTAVEGAGADWPLLLTVFWELSGTAGFTRPLRVSPSTICWIKLLAFCKSAALPLPVFFMEAVIK